MPPIDDLDTSGGIPMTDGSDSMPSDADIDTLLAGGTPNQDRVPMGTPKAEDEGTEIHENGKEPAPTDKTKQSNVPDPKAPTIDPALQPLQAALAKLTPEQRTALGIQSGPQPVEVVHKGEKLNIPVDKQVPLMQMGLDYSLKMRQLNQERADFEKTKGTTSESERYYGEIDRVAKANPKWWQHVQAEYAKFTGNGGNVTDDPSESQHQAVSPELRAALSKITELEGKLNGYLDKSSKAAEQQQHEAEDRELDTQIAAFSKEHPEFDWMTADAKSGLVLADRIVVHAQENGINNFRAAARDYLHKELIARAEVRVKDSLADQIRNATKKGVVNTTKKPSGLTAPKDVHTRDYGDLMREGLAELGG